MLSAASGIQRDVAVRDVLGGDGGVEGRLAAGGYDGAVQPTLSISAVLTR